MFFTTGSGNNYFQCILPIQTLDELFLFKGGGTIDTNIGCLSKLTTLDLCEFEDEFDF